MRLTTVKYFPYYLLLQFNYIGIKPKWTLRNSALVAIATLPQWICFVINYSVHILNLCYILAPGVLMNLCNVQHSHCRTAPKATLETQREYIKPDNKEQKEKEVGPRTGPWLGC